MSETPWFRVGQLAFARMAPLRRVPHVRKHLLNRAERWWRICGTGRDDLGLAGLLFAEAGFPVGAGANDRDGPHRGPLADFGAALHDDLYAVVYRSVLERLAEQGSEARFEGHERADGEREVTITCHRLGVRVVARGRDRLRVRTAYRPVSLVSARDDSLAGRTCVRFDRLAASLLGDGPESGEEA